ncbi:hyalin-like [Ptychodera flava]|uniref:hyalin-like n=1 Tax=Ptychodera flava TaxID=63121 RepID=UPI003969D202
MAGNPLSPSSNNDCCATCLATFGCKAWVYVWPVGCFLKNAAGPTSSWLLGMTTGIVQDSEKPILTCPPSIETDSDTYTMQVTWLLPTATDNSGTARVSGNREPGNSGKPAISCPPGIETSTHMSDIQVTWSIPNAMDNSGSVNVTGSHEPGSNFTIGVTTVSYVAEDPSGNIANCSFSVRVTDSGKPVITCPAGIETTTYIDMPNIKVTWAFPNAMDNSGRVSVTGSHEPGSNFTIGVTTVSYVAEDPSGNTANCWFSVKVTG